MSEAVLRVLRRSASRGGSSRSSERSKSAEADDFRVLSSSENRGKFDAEPGAGRDTLSPRSPSRAGSGFRDAVGGEAGLDDLNAALDGLEATVAVMPDEEELGNANAVDTKSGEQAPAADEEEFVGFSSGKGKRIVVSAEMRARAEKFLAADAEPSGAPAESKVVASAALPPVEEQKSELGVDGFKTGRGRRVSVSAEGLKRAQKLLDDGEGDKDDSKLAQTGSPDKKREVVDGFQTGKGKRVQVSAEGLKKAQQLLDEGEGDKGELQSARKGSPVKNREVFDGFQTGKGKRVQVSAEGLKKAQQLFDEGAGDLEAVKSVRERETEPEREFEGFQTGKGRRVQVSEDGMKKAQKLLEHDAAIDPIPAAVEKDEPAGEMAGFQTGKGRRVQVSAEGLKKAQQLLDDGDGEGAKTAVRPREPDVAAASEFEGFKSGRGRQVTISEEGMRKAQKILEAEGGQNPEEQEEVVLAPPSPFSKDSRGGSGTEGRPGADGGAGGFVWGNKKPVAVSEAGLERARKMFEEDGGNNNGDSHHDAQADLGGGFATGRGKTVAVSKEALDRARRMMDEDDEGKGREKRDRDEGDVFSGGASQADDDAGTQGAKGTGGKAPRTEKVDVVAVAAPPASATPRIPRQLVKAFEQQQETPGSTARLSLTAKTPGPREDDASSAGTPFSRRQGLSSVGSQKSTGKATKTRPYQAPARRSINAPAIPVTVATDARTPLTAKTPGADRTPASAVTSQQVKSPKAAVGASGGGSALQNGRLRDVATDKVAAAPPVRRLRDLAGGSVLRTYTAAEYKAAGVNSSVLSMTCESAFNFRFDRGAVGPEAMRQKLIEAGAAADLLTKEWVENHYGLIVWKLACMERSFPSQLGGLYCTKNAVLRQLKYRYDREIERAERPILRKICERDDASTRYMVLVVTRIIDLGEDASAQPQRSKPQEEVNAPKDAGGDESPSAAETDAAAAAAADLLKSFATIEVSDGWYRIPAKLDAKLTEHLVMGRIFPGLKLRIFGARLQGVTEACPPLDLPESAFLALSVNGCRRAKWDAKLGARFKEPFPISIASIKPKGGLIPRIDVVIQRRMPKLFMEREGEGQRFVSHNEKMESAVQIRQETDMELLVEKRKDELMAQFAKEDEEMRAAGKRVMGRLQFLRAEEDLLNAFMFSATVSDSLSLEQKALLDAALQRLQMARDEQVAQEMVCLQEDVQKKREVVPFVDLEVSDYPMDGDVTQIPKVRVATLRVLNPADEMLENVLVEGARLSVFGLEVGNWHAEQGDKPFLKTGKFTSWEAHNTPPGPGYDSFFVPRVHVPLSEMAAKLTLDARFDWAGFALQVPPVVCGKDFLMYFLADGSNANVALVVEVPRTLLIFGSAATDEASKAALAPLILRNLQYKAYDDIQHLHIAVATVRTEVVHKIPPQLEQVLFEREREVQLVNARVQEMSAKGVNLPQVPLSLQPSRVGQAAMVAEAAAECAALLPVTIHPFQTAVFTPNGVACVEDARDVLVSSDCGAMCACGRSLASFSESPARLGGVQVVVDNGVTSNLCFLTTGDLTRMLSDDSAPAIEGYLAWLRNFLRTGKCFSVEVDAEFCAQRQASLRRVRAGEFATPALVTVLLLNYSCVTVEDDSDDLCCVVPPAKNAAVPEPIKFRQKEWSTFLRMLWAALSCKRWMMTFSQTQVKKMAGQSVADQTFKRPDRVLALQCVTSKDVMERCFFVNLDMVDQMRSKR